MRMLKFWMVLSSIVLGMAIPVGQGYAQEEMVEEELEVVAGLVVENEEPVKVTEEAVPGKSDIKEVEPPEEAVTEVSTEKIEADKVVLEEVIPEELEPIGEDEEDVEIASIDTIDLNDPQGNWLIKRFWFNKSEHLYEQMSQRVQRILDFGSEFQQKSVDLDQKLFDPFYLDIGISRGKLAELVDSLIEQLTENDEATAERDQEESEYLQRLEEEKGTLEQLKANIEGVSDIDTAVNNALATFNERANLSRNYHSKVWHLLQEIAHELNDKRARELYYTIKSLARSVVDIEEYITSPFLQYFDELSNTADDQINRIKQEVAVLKQKGIDLKEKVDELKNVQQNEELEEAAQQGYNTAELEQQKSEEKERGFFSSIGSMVQYMWNEFYSFLQKLFTPTKKPIVKAEVEQHEAKEQVVDMAPVETGVIEPQEMPEIVEIQEAELELASDAEQQEAMTAGAEEVELIKAVKEVEVAAPENDMSDMQEETDPSSLHSDVISRHSASRAAAEEAQPAPVAAQELITPPVETELEQE